MFSLNTYIFKIKFQKKKPQTYLQHKFFEIFFLIYGSLKNSKDGTDIPGDSKSCMNRQCTILASQRDRVLYGMTATAICTVHRYYNGQAWKGAHVDLSSMGTSSPQAVNMLIQGALGFGPIVVMPSGVVWQFNIGKQSSTMVSIGLLMPLMSN